MTRLRKPQALSKAAFARYGDVIEVGPAPRQINYGLTERHHNLANIEIGRENGQPVVNIFRSTPKPLPIEIKIMERHLRSSQLFMPLSGRPYLVVVAPQGDFVEDEIEVFLAQSHQGVNYAPGTWHHYCLALNAVSDFLVIDSGEAEDCEEVRLSHPFKINL